MQQHGYGFFLAVDFQSKFHCGIYFGNLRHPKILLIYGYYFYFIGGHFRL